MEKDLFNALFDDKDALTRFFRKKCNDTEANRALILKTMKLKYLYCLRVCAEVSRESCKLFDEECTCRHGYPCDKNGDYLW